MADRQWLIRQAKFGSSGVLLIAGAAQTLIPIEELFALAQAQDARFTPPAKGPLVKVKAA
jgi:hypothetical protein